MPRRKYDTPHRSRVVKTRMTEEEYADFAARLAPYGISQSEFIRRAIQGASMEYFRSEVMELCHGAGLYQIDLLNGSANRVTEREYWAKKKGQAALDQENAALAAEGKPTKPTRFETDKEKLRQIIRNTLNESFTVEDFARKLLQYGVTVKESRGRFSYLTPDRTKPITARKLGDSFDKAAVLAALEQNALRSEHTLTSNDGIPLGRTLSSIEGASTAASRASGQLWCFARITGQNAGSRPTEGCHSS